MVLDAGTGIRSLGAFLAGTDHTLTLLFTHLHTDHISGFPFFAPLFEADRPIDLIPYCDPTQASAAWSPLVLMDGTHFPVPATDVPSACRVATASPATVLKPHGLQLDRLRVNHPGGAWGYRLTHEGRSFVFIPDNELSAPSSTLDRDELTAFCHGADVLCHDAQYLPSERDERSGWGHSVVSDVQALARAADVGHLVLFHHDPERSDAAIDHIQAASREALQPHAIRCTAAYEGLQLTL